MHNTIGVKYPNKLTPNSTKCSVLWVGNEWRDVDNASVKFGAAARTSWQSTASPSSVARPKRASLTVLGVMSQQRPRMARMDPLHRCSCVSIVTASSLVMVIKILSEFLAAMLIAQGGSSFSTWISRSIFSVMVYSLACMKVAAEKISVQAVLQTLSAKMALKSTFACVPVRLASIVHLITSFWRAWSFTNSPSYVFLGKSRQCWIWCRNPFFFSGQIGDCRLNCKPGVDANLLFVTCTCSRLVGAGSESPVTT